MFELIIAIIGLICTIMIINAAFRLGSRVAVATEASQLLLQALYDSMSEEAKDRAREIVAKRKENTQRQR
jgi:hypothetical protein